MLCLALWQLMRRYSVPVARAAVLFYWLNPAAILDGAVLGYLDPWLGALTMVSLLALDRGAFAWCGAALALTALTKLQILLILPAIGLALLHRAGRDWWKAALAAALAAPRRPRWSSRRSSGSARCRTWCRERAGPSTTTCCRPKRPTCGGSSPGSCARHTP